MATRAIAVLCLALASCGGGEALYNSPLMQLAQGTSQHKFVHDSIHFELLAEGGGIQLVRMDDRAANNTCYLFVDVGRRTGSIACVQTRGVPDGDR